MAIPNDWGGCQTIVIDSLVRPTQACPLGSATTASGTDASVVVVNAAPSAESVSPLLATSANSYSVSGCRPVTTYVIVSPALLEVTSTVGAGVS